MRSLIVFSKFGKRSLGESDTVSSFVQPSEVSQTSNSQLSEHEESVPAGGKEELQKVLKSMEWLDWLKTGQKDRCTVSSTEQGSSTEASQRLESLWDGDKDGLEKLKAVLSSMGSTNSTKTGQEVTSVGSGWTPSYQPTSAVSAC